MSHYAKVLYQKVIKVIVAEDKFFESFVDDSPGEWIKTSYNTRGNVHYDVISNTPDGGIALRGNYAGIGFTYDTINDVFYAPQPYPSWILNSNTWTWEPPVEYPADGNIYIWDEASETWALVTT